MSDSFTNSEKEKVLESLVSPIKKQERRYSDFDAKNNEENSVVLALIHLDPMVPFLPPCFQSLSEGLETSSKTLLGLRKERHDASESHLSSFLEFHFETN